MFKKRPWSTFSINVKELYNCLYAWAVWNPGTLEAPDTTSKVGHPLKIELNKGKGTWIILLENNLCSFYESRPSPPSSPFFPLGLECWSLQVPSCAAHTSVFAISGSSLRINLPLSEGGLFSKLSSCSLCRSLQLRCLDVFELGG